MDSWVSLEFVVMVLLEYVKVNSFVVWGIDLSSLEQELVVQRQHEGLVSCWLICKVVWGLCWVKKASGDEGIRLCAKLTGAVVDGEVIFGEGFGPAGLLVAELLGSGEVLEIVVVRVDLDAVQSSSEVGPLLLEGFDNGKKFFIIDVVVELCGDHQLGVKGNRSEILSTAVHLGEYSSYGIVRGMAFEDYEQGGVKVAEDWGRSESFLEEGEYTLALAVPVPGSVLSGESVEEFCDSRVVIDELAIKVSEPQEGLYLFHVLG
ncbi:hypothetical protein C0989_002802 [Termitomyces sp. Mn162]|nr:hypothetical protein C0989_002802 [Termitomyces sp. Mn162]